VLACDRGELVDVHDIFGRFLVARAEYELKLVGLDPNSLTSSIGAFRLSRNA
jgi:hypothetical protein